MDLDGFLKLNDAQRDNATAQATIASAFATADSTEADVPGKLAAADLTEEKANKQRYDNLAEFLGIQRDSEAHDHLLRMRIKALQEVERIIGEREHLESSLLHVAALASGSPDWDACRNGWLAFAYLRDRSPIEAIIKAAAVPLDDSVFAVESWNHPTHEVAKASHDKNGGALFQWAAQHSYYPRWGTAAYMYFGSFLQALSDAAALEAEAIQARIDDAKKAADAIQQQDWDRLKNPAGKPAAA